jgi:anti-sigma B factor antagonist
VQPPVIRTLPAEIDAANHAEVHGRLEAACAPGVAVVIADLTGTDFCDSSGFRVLIRAHQAAVARGVQLRLAVTPGGVVSRMLDLLDLGRVLSVYPSLEAALEPPADAG